MATTKKATTAKKTTVKKTGAKKVTAKKVVLKKSDVKSLRMASDESQAFLLVSSDFDGKTRRILQFVCSFVLLGILGTMIYMAFLANDIAQSVLEANLLGL